MRTRHHDLQVARDAGTGSARTRPGGPAVPVVVGGSALGLGLRFFARVSPVAASRSQEGSS